MSLLKINNRLEYVMFHLGQHFELSPRIRSLIHLVSPGDAIPKGVTFIISEDRFDPERVITLNNIPVLFPGDPDMPIFSFENDSLIFHQDILTSAFYLLSGQQEWENPLKDDKGRFPFKESVQYKFVFIQRPVVNYYFQIITEAIGKYCTVHSIPFQKKTSRFKFCLTHDIDRIAAYSTREVANRFIQLIGLRPHGYPSRAIAFKAFLKQSLGWMHLRKKDPYWNFEEMRDLEKKFGFRSTWFFLEKTANRKDSKYHFDDVRIKGLLRFLISEGCEIALHGSIDAAGKSSEINASLQRLEKVSHLKINGIRQHFLVYDVNTTPLAQQEAGLKYDSSIGFAEHDGFRNSYCLPFRLYDFNSEKMLDLWELPLIAMDTTFLHYRKLNFTEVKESMRLLLDEVKKFDGTFVFLCHNSNFDEYEFPGIKNLYSELLQMIIKQQPQLVLCKDAIA